MDARGTLVDFLTAGPEERTNDSSKSLSDTPRSCILKASAFSFSADTGMDGFLKD
jgi:hypothetical protein